MPDRILLTQLRRIGDVLMTTPSVAAMRAAHPRAHIAFLTEAPSDQIFRHNPHVDQVWVYPRGGSPWAQISLARRLRKERFDLVVDFFGNPRSAFLSRLTGAPRRIGFDFRGRGWAYTERVPVPRGVRYSAGHKTALLEPLGIKVDSYLPQVFLGAAERDYATRQLQELGVKEGELLVALFPVSRRRYKVWPPKNFARLADILIERYGARVLLMGGPGDEHFTGAVRQEMRHRPLPPYEAPSLLESAALLERAHLYVGNDNGPRHFAIALGTPTVTVFGQGRPENWTPPDQPMHRTVEYDPGCKSSCTYPRCAHLDCINKVPYLSVQGEVESALEEILRDGSPAVG